MMRRLLAMIACLSAAPAFAERQVLSPDAFEGRVAGRVAQAFDQKGDLFGTEYYLPNRNVIWQSAADGTCVTGSWAARADLVCYKYDGGYGNCVQYFAEDDRLIAIDWLAGKPTSTVYTLNIITAALPICPAG